MSESSDLLALGPHRRIPFDYGLRLLRIDPYASLAFPSIYFVGFTESRPSTNRRNFAYQAFFTDRRKSSHFTHQV